MTNSEVTKRVRELIPAIRARRDDVEQARRIPADLAGVLRSTGIFSLTVPRDLGGLQADPLEIMRIIETVAEADGSTGWCAMVGIGNNIASGYMQDAGAREVFADPTAPTAGLANPSGAAVRVPGGVRVSGRWPFASGVTHCDWVWLGCVVMENGEPRMTEMGPEMVHVCMPVGDIQIHDTWFVSGLCGTGSNDVSASDVFVPEERIFLLLDSRTHRPEPLYQMPPLGIFVYQVACVSLGIARAALDELIEVASRRTPTLYTQVLAEQAPAQVELARAETSLGAARSFLYESVSAIWEAVRNGGTPTARQLAMGRSACTLAAETAASVTATANRLAGGSSLYSRSSVQRHARDAEALMHHFTVAPQTWEQAGRMLLGKDPGVPAF